LASLGGWCPVDCRELSGNPLKEAKAQTYHLHAIAYVVDINIPNKTFYKHILCKT
jgi:hypothetical protein